MAAPTSIEAVLACLNETNSSNILMADVTFSAPTAGTFGTKNTKVTLTAVPGGSYIGENDYKYNRLELNQLTLTGDTLGQDYVLSNGSTLADLVDIINDLNDTNLTEADLENWTSPVTQPTVSTPTSVVLTARNTSYAWIGNVTVNLTLSKPHIKTVAPNDDLNGLLLSHLKA